MSESVFDEVFSLAASLENEAVAEHRARGGRVVGFACLLTPAELIAAAGVLPFRIRGLGRSRTDLADARLSRFNCNFCRSCLQLALEGDYRFLDGLIETNGCDQLRGMFEQWQHAAPARFFHYLKVPHQASPAALAFFAAQLRELGAALGDAFEAPVDEGALRSALREREGIRARLEALQGLRERETPALSGAEALAVALLQHALPAARYGQLLDEVLAACERSTATRPGARMILGGAATDELELLRAMEAMGCTIVADTLCFGTRAFCGALPAAADPFEQLARRYLAHGTCPRMSGDFALRLEALTAAVRRARADGVILLHNKFCDMHGIDNALLRVRLEERGVPVLTVEKEYGGTDLARVRTRVQAFLERIGARR